MNTKQLKWLSYVTFFVMFFATFGGTVVTRTGSGLGCGQEFPLCHGKFIPAHTVESLIEYSHRLVSGLAGLLALGVIIAFWRFNKRRDLRMYSVMTFIFVMVQAVMGALTVIYNQTSAVLALHFGFSLIAFASSLMLALGIRRLDKAKGDFNLMNLPRVSRSFRNLTWITTIYCYVVVYIGAYVSHSDSAGGCSGWPLCNGEWIPEMSGGVGIAFVHRLGALVLFIMIAVLAHFAYHNNHGNREVQMLGIATLALCLVQVLSGAGIIATLDNPELYIFAALLHNLILASLFGVLCYLSVRVWQLNK